MEMGPFVGGLFGLVLLGIYIFMIVLVWKFVKAHELLAESAKEIAEYLKSNKPV